MSAKCVSVVIPAYNAQEYLQQAIESVLAQTYRHYEILVVDDGSTDDTAVIAQRFGEAVRYIYQPNRGLSAARNTAIRHASADTIALLDADDLWEPTFLATMVPYLERHPDAAAVYCGFRYIDSTGQIVGVPIMRVVPPAAFYQTLICEGNWLAPCSVLFRKGLAETVGLFDESLRAVEDTDLWAKLSATHEFWGQPETLVRYRRHGNNMTKDPQRMVTANYQQTRSLFGAPEGDSATWPVLKRCAYARVFRAATSRYLAAGMYPKSADSFVQLLQISVSTAQSMKLWRELVRIHLPDEERHNPATAIDPMAAQRDVRGLLDELAATERAGDLFQHHQHRIRGSAYLALAEEHGRAGRFIAACVWLARVIVSSPSFFVARRYWGTFLRALRYAQPFKRLGLVQPAS